MFPEKAPELTNEIATVQQLCELFDALHEDEIMFLFHNLDHCVFCDHLHVFHGRQVPGIEFCRIHACPCTAAYDTD